jgi:ubiquinone/menaquinone biosynthesis C-methylase UbiE
MDEIQLQQIAQQLRKPDGDDGIKTGEMMNQGNKLINEYAIEKLDPVQGDTILEIGMGNGYFIKDIVNHDPSISYTGIDYSATMVAAAKEWNKEMIGKQVQVLQGVANNIPFGGDQFTKAIGINILYFWEDPRVELAEIRRVLKPGGKLILGIRPKHAMQKMPFTRYGFTMYSKEELVSLLTDNLFFVTEAFEVEEPAFEMGGNTIVPETLIVTAMKQ